jgi:glutamate racemase
MCKKITIGVIDSGVGGLTVLKKLINIDNVNFIYFADTANLPYGDKTIKQVTSYMKAITHWMLSIDIDMLVIACNTIDAAYLYNQTIFAQYKFRYGIVNIIIPTVEGVLYLYPDVKKVGVISTTLTAKSKTYEKAFFDVAKKYNIQKPYLVTIACPDLVPWIESNMQNSEVGYQLLYKYLKPLVQQNIEILVLGCTHYALIKNMILDVWQVIQKEYTQDIIIVDPANFVLKNVQKILEHKTSNEKAVLNTNVKYFTTDHSKTLIFQNTIQKILGCIPIINNIKL